MKCHFCDTDRIAVSEEYGEAPCRYDCPRCGKVCLARAAAEDMAGEGFDEDEKKIISIVLRNEYERRGGRGGPEPLTLDYIRKIPKQYTPLEPLEKIDSAFLKIQKKFPHIGTSITINTDNDYPYYHCSNYLELKAILHLLLQENLIEAPEPGQPSIKFSMTTKGYEKLSELRKPGIDSQNCFVATWFAPEMNGVYEDAMKPAIEYIEEGAEQSRFNAVKVDNVEHINDINDEIIAAIRRSRFMVCDLTGYRGGVYFEAGFAYGLGLDIIYTCRKDWVKPDILKDDDGKDIKDLLDTQGRKIEIKKEGVHFDLEHMNRIEWEEDKLEEFKEKLEKRIKAVIF